MMAKTSGTPTCSAVVDAEGILKAREVINDIYVDDKVKDYIVDLVCATRDPDHYKIAVPDFIQLGARRARPSRSRWRPRPMPS
jgi:MoxR-like ATPase